MANVSEQAQWEDGVYLIDPNDPVQGGPDGVDNLPHKQLANRTAWLKQHVDQVVAASQGYSSLEERLNQYDAFQPEQQTTLVAGVQQALSMAGMNAKALFNLRETILAQREVVLKNKFVIQGFVLSKSDVRQLHLSETGTVGTGTSRARIDGITVTKADNDYALNVPTNETGEPRTVYAYLHHDGSAYTLGIADTVPDKALLLYRLEIPAGDTANDLSNVTLVDERVIQPANSWVSSFRPTEVFGFPYTLPRADYGVSCDVLEATNKAAVGELIVFDRTTNGAKLQMTGTADNVRVRVTLLNPNYQ
mgnify:CR=1 FL=1